MNIHQQQHLHNSSTKSKSLEQIRQQEGDLPYPIDWRRYPAEIKEPKEATNIFVKCKLHNKMTLKEIIQSGIKTVEQELASHGVLSVRASPLSRRQCREQLRSHVRYNVIFDFIATKNFILTGIVHEAAETVYRELETNFPLSVSEVLMGITDETRSFLSAEALVASGRTDHINNEHAYIVSPGGKAEANQLRQRLELAEQDKAFSAGMRIKRPNRKKQKFEAPPVPAWLVKVEERKKKEQQRQEELNVLLEPGRAFHLDRCGRCSRYDAEYNRAAAASSSLSNHRCSSKSSSTTKMTKTTRPISSSSTASKSSMAYHHHHHAHPSSVSACSPSPIPKDPTAAAHGRRKRRGDRDDDDVAHDRDDSSTAIMKTSENEVDHQQQSPIPTTERKPAFRFPVDENQQNETTSSPLFMKTKQDGDENDDVNERNTTNHQNDDNDEQQQQQQQQSFSGDPSIAAMKRVLEMVSRRQGLRPMNLLTITHRSQNSSSMLADKDGDE